MEISASVMLRPLDNVPEVREVGGYLTVEYAAELLGVNVGAVSWAFKQGRLRGVQIDGRTRLVNKRSLQRYMRRRAAKKDW